MDKLRQAIRDALIPVPEMWDAAAGEFNYPRLFAALDAYEPTVLEALLGAAAVRRRFCVDVTGGQALKTSEFRFFMEENKLDNSYTAFANRIGLSAGGTRLSERSEVVLNFPFKDCVLQGGQSSEEGEDVVIAATPDGIEESRAKRKEIFFNEVLAADEIDRLFEEKALTGWRRFTKDGEVAVGEIARDAGGVVRENMIIRGNNLLALHSLRGQFSERVKLIYIDPPYNTGGDKETFSYNNAFNHAAWLTFMRNRLVAAKDMLRQDGFIVITIDHVELFYLGALADEVFGRENRIGLVTVYINPKGRQHERFFAASTEFMLVYANDISVAKLQQLAIDDDKAKSFNKEDEEGKYRLDPFMRIRNTTRREKKPHFYYPIYVSPDLSVLTTDKTEGYHEVYPISNGVEYTWKIKRDSFARRLKKGEYVAMQENGRISICNKYREQQVYKNLWVDKKYFPEFQGTHLLKKLLGRNGFSYPKSLYAVVDALKIMTEEDDIVMDFFAGSGTVGHACLHLNKEDGGNRKFILIEQLGEHIDICVERNQKVLSQENLSEGFLYCELAQWNGAAKRRIAECADLPALQAFFDEMRETYFLDYNFNIKKFADEVAPSDEFAALSLDEQKRLFAAMLDLNMLYVPRREMESDKFGIAPDDARCTNDFYGVADEEAEATE